MRAFSEDLPNMRSLSELLLGDNALGDKGAALLARVLPQIPQLRSPIEPFVISILTLCLSFAV